MSNLSLAWVCIPYFASFYGFLCTALPGTDCALWIKFYLGYLNYSLHYSCWKFNFGEVVSPYFWIIVLFVTDWSWKSHIQFIFGHSYKHRNNWGPVPRSSPPISGSTWTGRKKSEKRECFSLLPTFLDMLRWDFMIWISLTEPHYGSTVRERTVKIWNWVPHKWRANYYFITWILPVQFSNVMIPFSSPQP